jgi:hypothetical protein
MNLPKRTFLNITIDAEETRESGLSREHLEKAMFDLINLKCISREEKAIYVKMMKVFLDRKFPAKSLNSARSTEILQTNEKDQTEE